MRNVTLNQSMRRRLLQGMGATALGPLITAATQLGAVPILLSAWGAAKYGDWLLLSAVPTYLALSDIGFSDASASDMTLRAAAGDRKGALRTFQSAWMLLTIVSAVVGALCAVAVWWMPWREWLNLTTVTDRQSSAILTVLIAWVAVGQQTRVLEGGFRCDGQFATGAFWGNILRLCEAVVVTGAAVMTDSLPATASAGLAVRLAGSLGYWSLLRARAPWLTLGIRQARWQTVRKLITPAIGFMALPAAQAISLQGFTVLIGICAGPAAVVVFSTLRTMTRVNFQFLTAIARALWPEFSAAFGAGNLSLARSLHRSACKAAIWVSLVGGLALCFAGPAVYRAWIGTAVGFDPTCFYVLVAAISAHSLWFISAVAPMSANSHQRIALMYLGSALASLALASMLIPVFGLTGAAIALLFADAGLCWFVLRAALRQVQDTFGEFAVALARIPMAGQARS